MRHQRRQKNNAPAGNGLGKGKDKQTLYQQDKRHQQTETQTQKMTKGLKKHLKKKAEKDMILDLSFEPKREKKVRGAAAGQPMANGSIPISPRKGYFRLEPYKPANRAGQYKTTVGHRMMGDCIVKNNIKNLPESS